MKGAEKDCVDWVPGFCHVCGAVPQQTYMDDRAACRGLRTGVPSTLQAVYCNCPLVNGWLKRRLARPWHCAK